MSYRLVKEEAYAFEYSPVFFPLGHGVRQRTEVYNLSTPIPGDYKVLEIFSEWNVSLRGLY